MNQVQASVGAFHKDIQQLKESAQLDDTDNTNEPPKDTGMESVGTVHKNVMLDDMIGSKYYYASGSARFSSNAS